MIYAIAGHGNSCMWPCTLRICRIILKSALLFVLSIIISPLTYGLCMNNLLSAIILSVSSAYLLLATTLWEPFKVDIATGNRLLVLFCTRWVYILGKTCNVQFRSWMLISRKTQASYHDSFFTISQLFWWASAVVYQY